jgi:hypothetical protein
MPLKLKFVRRFNSKKKKQFAALKFTKKHAPTQKFKFSGAKVQFTNTLRSFKK